MTCFHIFSRRIVKCTRWKQLFSIYCWHWTWVIWQCWHYSTCLPHSTASTMTRYWGGCKSYSLGSLHISVAVHNTYAHQWPVLHRQRFCTEYHRDWSSGQSYSFCTPLTCCSWWSATNWFLMPIRTDTQIYGFCRPADSADLCDKVSVCIDEVSAWMASNQLQLNHTHTKSEVF